MTLLPNTTHGITRARAVPFHSLLGLGPAIEKLLIQSRVRLHPGQKGRQYMEA